MAPHAALRTATGRAHEEVDAAFGAFRLDDKASYAAFLTAHARALPAVEAALDGYPGLPAFSPRVPALAADLAALGRPMPAPMALPTPASPAEAWGMLYVIEGSRLGGAMLARRVAAGLPKAYLAAAHPRGGWRSLLAALDAAGLAGGAPWLADAERAAWRAFDLYKAAAAEQAVTTPAA